MSMSFTGPTCQPLLRIFGSRSGITSQLAFRSGMMLQSALGHKNLLCIICAESVFLLCQDMELVLDCKVGLGVNDCLGGGILIWKSGKELFKEHLFCKCMLEAFVHCYNPHSGHLERDPCILNCGILWEPECCDLCNVLSVCLQLDLTVLCLYLVPLFLNCSKLMDDI